MEVDWDLHAVVRPFCSTAATTTTTTTAAAAGATFSWAKNENIIGVDFCPNPFPTRNDNSIEQILNVLNNPLEFPKLQKPPPSLLSLPISPISVIGGLQDPPPNHYQQSFGVSKRTTSNARSTRSKKRKNIMKKVCQVPAEKLSSDVWCWRKYGQKPIKGSPYPRGYYRCSTSKGCLARKQVERNRSDPDMFILTYTGDHSHPVPTHRNSLAGSTRTKPTTSGGNGVTKNKPTSSPAVSPPTSQSPVTEKTEDNDTEDDTFDSIIDDDFFEGLDELVSPVTGDKFPVIPWLSMPAGGS